MTMHERQFRTAWTEAQRGRQIGCEYRTALRASAPMRIAIRPAREGVIPLFDVAQGAGQVHRHQPASDQRGSRRGCGQTDDCCDDV